MKNNPNKQAQLDELKVVLERCTAASARAALAGRVSLSKAFYDPALFPIYWRAEALEAQLKAAERMVLLSIYCTENVSNFSLSGLMPSSLEQYWEAVFWSSFSFANSAMLQEKIESFRKDLARYDRNFERANAEAALLRAKAKAVVDNWRKPGVPEALIGEIIERLNLGGIKTELLDFDRTWQRGVASLTVSIDEYEATLDRYVDNVQELEKLIQK